METFKNRVQAISIYLARPHYYNRPFSLFLFLHCNGDSVTGNFDHRPCKKWHWKLWWWWLRRWGEDAILMCVLLTAGLLLPGPGKKLPALLLPQLVRLVAEQCWYVVLKRKKTTNCGRKHTKKCAFHVCRDCTWCKIRWYPMHIAQCTHWTYIDKSQMWGWVWWVEPRAEKIGIEWVRWRVWWVWGEELAHFLNIVDPLNTTFLPIMICAQI